MPIITFTNPKGGSSKSTSALILATTLVQFGQRTAIVDCDPNAPLIAWAKGRNDKDLHVVAADESSLMRTLKGLREQYAYVICDTEGTGNTTTGYALAWANLAILPFSMSQLDVHQAARAIGFIEDQGMSKDRKIPYRLLFTKTNPAFQTRVERQIRAEADADRVQYLQTTLMLRQAYIEIFARQQTLWELPENEVSGVPRAIENAIAYAKEVVGIINNQETVERAA